MHFQKKVRTEATSAGHARGAGAAVAIAGAVFAGARASGDAHPGAAALHVRAALAIRPARLREQLAVCTAGVCRVFGHLSRSADAVVNSSAHMTSATWPQHPRQRFKGQMLDCGHPRTPQSQHKTSHSDAAAL